MERVVDGYRFSSDEDAKMAEEELQRVNYISEKLSEDDPKSVLLVYNKSIQSGIFTTPVGIDFLKSIQSYLRKNPQIDNEDIADIPIRISYADALILKQNKRYESLNTKEKNYRQPYMFSLLINVVLVIMVIAMFVIALKADNPNMLNYKTAILNEYSEWEQELKDREQAVREKESELGINP
ncbi:MAG: hypothetical protein Q4D29_08610 [Lachnospiraceae bacterium]|nr:hypothetical protein [Lachnospiraceae bacterium]